MIGRTLVTTFYLVISSTGKIEVKKNKPAIRLNQIGIKIKLELPQALFERPVFEATVRVEDQGEASRFLSTDIQEGIQRAIAEQAGMSVNVITVEQIGRRR